MSPRVITRSRVSLSVPCSFFVLATDYRIFRVTSLGMSASAGVTIDASLYTPNHISAPSILNLAIQSGVYDLDYSTDGGPVFSVAYTETFSISHAYWTSDIIDGFSRDRSVSSIVWYPSYYVDLGTGANYYFAYVSTDSGQTQTRYMTHHGVSLFQPSGVAFLSSRHNGTDAFFVECFINQSDMSHVWRIYLVDTSGGVTIQGFVPDGTAYYVRTGTVRYGHPDTYYFIARDDIAGTDWFYSYNWDTVTVTPLDSWNYSYYDKKNVTGLFSTKEGTLLWATRKSGDSAQELCRWAVGDPTWSTVPTPISLNGTYKIAQDDATGVIFIPSALIFSVDDGLTWKQAANPFPSYFFASDVDGTGVP
jgi:hypothetical protein